jgi:sirohydrochlorin cobaltochelatase
MASAFFFVTHGSRESRSLEQLNRLVALANTIFPDFLIGGGCLEGLSVNLADQLLAFSQTNISETFFQIKVIPLFLLPGMHVRQDLPEQVQLAQSRLTQHRTTQNRSTQKSSDRHQFQITDYLGNHPDIAEILASKFLDFPDRRRILISHGSKLSGGNQLIEQLSSRVQAIPAYWSVAPSLISQIDNLIAQTEDQISVLPYFLFPGAISEAIANQIISYDRVTLLDPPFQPLQIVQMGMEMAIETNEPTSAPGP